MERHIIAFGGSILETDDGKGSVEYLLQVPGVDRPRVCFVPTASAEDAAYILRFYEAFGHDVCRPSHLRLFPWPPEDLRRFLFGQDIIYVGSGNTANMLAVWRVHGVDEALSEAWKQGIVVAGESAGANCWFEASVTDSFGPALAPLAEGLSLLPGSVCPHYDTEELRRPTYQSLVGESRLPPGLALEEKVGAHFVGQELLEVIGTVPDASAYLVSREDGEVVEVTLPARTL